MLTHAALQSARDRFENLRRDAARLWRASTREARAFSNAAVANARRWLNIALAPLERVLLSERARERLHAGAVYALIFAFLVSSVDFLLSGGPEFGAAPRTATHVAYASPIAPTTRPSARVETAAAETIAPEDIMAPAPRARVTPTSFTISELIAPPLADAAPKADVVEAPAVAEPSKAKAGA